MRLHLLLLTIVLIGCAPQPTLPLTPEVIRDAPGVREVTTSGPDSPQTRIIHILDWHFVAKDRFATDLGIEGEELERAYIQHLDDVEAVQRAQRVLLEHLVQQHGLRTIYREGVTAENLADVESLLVEILNEEEWRRRSASIIASAATDPDLVDQLSPILEDQNAITDVFREDRLRIGACCDLALEGQLCIMPAEDEAAYHAADPVKPGALEFDAAANERRETAICETVLREDNFAVVILGAAHNLADNVPAGCQYVRVSVHGLPHIKLD